MKLFINFMHGRISDGSGPIEPGRYYPMPDGIHRFIVRIAGDDLVIEIKDQGKTPVQRATVRRVSLFAGTIAKGEPNFQEYLVELDPGKPIYPLSSLVDQLLGMGLERHQISLIFSGTLREHLHLTSSSQLLTDGRTTHTEIAAVGNQKRHKLVTTEGASWALRHYEDKVLYIYLWDNAVDDPAAVLTALRQVRSGEFAPSATA